MARARSTAFDGEDETLKSHLSKLLSRFSRDARGGVALMAGLTFPVLFLAIGGSVDYARATSNQTKVQSALDSTLLALTRKDTSSIDLQVEGDKIFRSFLSTSEVDADITSVQFSAEGNVIAGEADISTKTFFLTFIGRPSMGGKVGASALPPARQPIEIALVLDVSGSMGNDLNGQTRIARMQTAVNQMFDTLDQELPSETKLSASLVPYSSSVNLSDYRDALKSGSMGGKNHQTDEDVWAAERLEASNGTSFTLSDKAPGGNKVPFVLEDEMSAAEPAARMAGLTENIADVRTDVANLTPSGWTAGHLGMVWGFYSLAPKWKNFWPNPPADFGHADKIIVLLSDGEFNTTFNIGDSVDLFQNAVDDDDDSGNGGLDLSTQNDNQLEADAYFQDVCSMARLKGITIYAVALSLDAATEAKLTTCAGSSGAVYAADTAEELNAAFKNIALQLGQRRLTM